jgi:hypothetical protein
MTRVWCIHISNMSAAGRGGTAFCLPSLSGYQVRGAVFRSFSLFVAPRLLTLLPGLYTYFDSLRLGACILSLGHPVD